MRVRYGISIVLLLIIPGYVNSLISMNNDSKKKWDVARDALCLAIDIFPDEEGKKKYLLLHLDGYLFSVAHGTEILSQKMYFILLLLGMYLSLGFVFLVTILSVQFFHFMQFSAKIITCLPHLHDYHLPLGNPGSATAFEKAGPIISK